MKFVRIIWILLISSTLVNCASRSQVGAVLGGASATVTCVELGISNPYLTATCGIIGAFAGAELMYNDDYDLHNATFVDHLNNGPQGSSYTNWYNAKTNSSGIIHTTRSYMKGPIKCKDYSATLDVSNQWPVLGYGSAPTRGVVHGVACQLPDGRWFEYE